VHYCYNCQLYISRCGGITDSFEESSCADCIYASQTSQSLYRDSDIWPDTSLVRARLSKLLVTWNKSDHCRPLIMSCNFSRHKDQSPFATTDSGPRKGSFRYSNCFSGVPYLAVIRCKRSNSCGVWMDRVGSLLEFYQICELHFITHIIQLTPASVVAAASLLICARASLPNIPRCAPGQFGEF
jgi:hypothetical protein